eukprot:CAMPEP_0172624638 /NCGR_PEP_ID=MMETSP1068-20121228/138309_1 /TAXON_ID=35684 /ORGANISM="Pseudopedinella elastica, Strain CCMP716" /LENGTH=35 /DNA_ID= /DNA_START= /DNA_END= /DNA_ORIENTATION=
MEQGRAAWYVEREMRGALARGRLRMERGEITSNTA